MSVNLTQSHQKEVELEHFLQLFRSRVTKHLQTIEAEFEDLQSDRLSADDVYNQKDIYDALQLLLFAVKSNVQIEMRELINMNALLLKQAMETAQKHKIDLTLDIGAVENRGMDRGLVIDCMTRIRSVELLNRVERLDVAEWTSNCKSIAALDERKASPKVSSTELSLHRSEDRIRELESQLRNNEQHISKSKQFQAMRQIIDKKNEQLRVLRERLQRYESDNEQLIEDD
ncbi:unnamed protein product [Albugo candida]|uniref:Leucine zipper transcription factor-like protein 1 n=2 Tax=Albugo candida TaxID=65357 RepID=A0A024GFF8_9STRA|nr:unnamed protein product [Albugo candida]|eukprot:CCI45620.1 unnamed protein product [Albugo candida]